MFYEDSRSNILLSNIYNLEIGIGLILIGLFLYSIGVMFFLDRGLLAMGNVIYYFRIQSQYLYIDVFHYGSHSFDRFKEYFNVFWQEIKANG